MAGFLNAIGAWFEKITNGWIFGTPLSKFKLTKNVEIEGTDDLLYTHEFQNKDGILAHLDDIGGFDDVGIGLSIDGDGNPKLGDEVTIFFNPISAMGAKNGSIRLLGSLEVDDVDGTQSSKFEVYNTGSYPRFNFLGTLTAGVGDTLTSAIRSGQASGRSEFYAEGEHQSGRYAKFSYDVRNIASLPTGDTIEMVLANESGNLLRLMFSGNGATYSAVVLDSINQRGLGDAADYSSNKQPNDYITSNWIKAQSGYNASVAQYFTHDASGNFQWINI